MGEWKDEHIKNLPDVFKKTKDSNNYKILEIERYAVNKFRAVLQELRDSLDLDLATGKTLDFYGELVGQDRGVANDDQYRLLIKTKIARNLSNGSYNSVIENIAKTLKCDKSEITISETDTPLVVELGGIPLDTIIKADLTAAQVTALVKSLLPVGVTLGSFLFEGTFEFAETESEYDEEKGFSDNEGTIGGYLGMTASDGQERVLPI